MAEGAEPAQDGCHQTAHQRAVAIGERLQSGMGGGAVELVIERAMLVQHAVEHIRRDPPRREAGHFGRSSESLRWHALSVTRRRGNSAKVRHATDRSTSLPCEYAKCKKRWLFAAVAQSIDGRTFRNARAR